MLGTLLASGTLSSELMNIGSCTLPVNDSLMGRVLLKLERFVKIGLLTCEL